MLAAAGLDFEVVPAAIDEDEVRARLTDLDPGSLAVALAREKALSIESASLILGADQVLECADGSRLDKPRSRRQALEQLRLLSGTTHHLHSAAALARQGEIIWNARESVAMTMRPLSEAFLDSYLRSAGTAILSSVGGYRIEERGVQLFERIEGSHFAILGLPLLPLLDQLRQLSLIDR